jgi:hypothetical protein
MGVFYWRTFWPLRGRLQASGIGLQNKETRLGIIPGGFLFLEDLSRSNSNWLTS